MRIECFLAESALILIRFQFVLIEPSVVDLGWLKWVGCALDFHVKLGPGAKVVRPD